MYADDQSNHFLLNKSWRYLELTLRILISFARRFWVLDIFFFAITLTATTKSSFYSGMKTNKRKDFTLIHRVKRKKKNTEDTLSFLAMALYKDLNFKSL